MSVLSTNELRKIFLDYFKSLHHEIVPSSSLIPENDPTLLFTNAGMVQFKEVFLGLETRSYKKAASVQRCMRAGGKHNDLENVGYTARHHTFFEMLGNFSFGDYFKREAIQFAWRFLTEVLKLPKERLWITVFREDTESESIWLNEIKVDPARFSRCGEKDNFWQMGDTGPCGPSTEIYYDHGEKIVGGPPGSPDADAGRYVELWNLVFMQYDRNIHGELKPLPKPCVDTGMGLERIAAVVQGVHDNYDIDLFMYLLKQLSQLIDHKNIRDTSMRVIVDHIRSVAFLIADGVVPSNEGRGYVLRRIIRRAVRHGYKLGQTKPFFYRMTRPLVTVMGEAYPELVRSQALIEQVIEQEEVNFSKTLSKGLKILDQETTNLVGREIPGAVIFQLYDTYGFPPDLTADIARERGLSMDYPGFNTAMEHQREQSQQAHHFTVDHTQKVFIKGETEFVGYESLIGEGKVTTLLQDNKPVAILHEGEKGVVVLDRTPFYAESGGQVGDSGCLYFDQGSFRVRDTQKQGSVYLHIGEVVKGDIHVKTAVRAEVDAVRQEIALNHSATHLLHEALRRVLGEHVTQKGSLVEAKRLRFDFAHSKALTTQEVQAVERLVNQQIRANTLSVVDTMTPEEAKEKGAMALFNERYGKTVRVLKMGDFSTEICGGTHVERTGEIGLFKIISESACAAGARRIEAVTGQTAIAYVESQEHQLHLMSDLIKASVENMPTKLKQILDDNRHLEKEITKLKQQLAGQQISGLVNHAIEVSGIKVLAFEVKEMDNNMLRSTVSQLLQQLGKAAVILGVVHDKKVQLVAAVSKDVLPHFKAAELLNHVAQQVGGRGGGRPDMAEGGGDAPQHLLNALQSVSEWVKSRVQ